jgi:hypothetical protein
MLTGGLMLDGTLYRMAFVPVLFSVLIAAFALAERPRAIGTTLAPDAFDGRRAFSTLTELRRTFPNRRPGSPGDDALARRVERDFRAAFGVGGAGSVRVSRESAETIDGEAMLTSVVGERVGRSNRRIVVVAQRDAAGTEETARLSGTAALLELARIFRGRALRRTLTLISTSGGTGGTEGLRDVLSRLGGPTDAVLVLGDLAGTSTRRPMVVPWSESGGAAPLRLRRTVEEAVRAETELDPGAPRALTQLARLAVPVTLTPQGAAGADGFSAVTLQASGERGPSAGTEVSGARLQAFGRGALRSVSALDNGPDVPTGPREYLVVQRRALPRWAVLMLAGLLLLPAVLAAVDGLARVRRRREPVAIWLRWLFAAAAPFVLAAVVARLLGLAGVVPALQGFVDPAAVPPEVGPLASVAFTLVVGFALRGPVGRALGVPRRPRDGGPYPVGAAAAIAVVLAALGVAVWAVNPYTALLLAPAVHLWLLAVVPEVQLRRPTLLLMIAFGLLPFLLVALYYAAQFGLDPVELAWMGLLVVAGGHAGPLGLLAWSLVLACAVGTTSVALRKRRRVVGGEPGEPDVTIRGPLSYAGPGSLGGTESALRR